MKTEQELIEDIRIKVKTEAELESNADAAANLTLALYHKGKKDAYLDVANSLCIFAIVDESIKE